MLVRRMQLIDFDPIVIMDESQNAQITQSAYPSNKQGDRGNLI